MSQRTPFVPNDCHYPEGFSMVVPRYKLSADNKTLIEDGEVDLQQLIDSNVDSSYSLSQILDRFLDVPPELRCQPRSHAADDVILSAADAADDFASISETFGVRPGDSRDVIFEKIKKFYKKENEKNENPQKKTDELSPDQGA